MSIHFKTSGNPEHNDEHKKPQMMGYKNISIHTTSHYTGLLTVDKWLDHQE